MTDDHVAVVHVMHPCDVEDGELVENTDDWYAQDLDGNVWVGNWTANTLVKLNGQTGARILSVRMDCPYGLTTEVDQAWSPYQYGCTQSHIDRYRTSF